MTGNGSENENENDDRHHIYRWVNIRRVIIFDFYSIVKRALAILLIFTILDLVGLQAESIDFWVFGLFCISLKLIEDRNMEEFKPVPLIFQIVRGSLLFSMRQGIEFILASHIRPYYRLNPTAQAFPELQWALIEFDGFLSQMGHMMKMKEAIILGHYIYKFAHEFILWMLREIYL